MTNPQNKDKSGENDFFDYLDRKINPKRNDNPAPHTENDWEKELDDMDFDIDNVLLDGMLADYFCENRAKLGDSVVENQKRKLQAEKAIIAKLKNFIRSLLCKERLKAQEEERRRILEALPKGNLKCDHKSCVCTLLRDIEKIIKNIKG